MVIQPAFLLKFYSLFAAGYIFFTKTEGLVFAGSLRGTLGAVGASEAGICLLRTG